MLPLLVTAAVIEHNGRFLLSRRPADVSHPLLWEFPGGKLEPNEDPAVCVVREVEEELAITVEVDGIFDVVYFRYPARPVLILVYRCRWVGGAIRNLHVAEHKWVTPEEMTAMELLPADYPIVERLRKNWR